MGHIIVLEGITRVGKTSVFRALQKKRPQWLFFEEVATQLSHKYDLPVGNKIGSKLDEMLLNKYMDDFRSAFLCAVAGSICIMDRSYISKLTYDFIKFCQSNFVDTTFLQTLDILKYRLGSLKPTMYIYFDIDIERLLRRKDNRQLKLLKTTFDRQWLEQLANSYKMLFNSIEKDVPVKIINANQDHGAIKKNVLSLIEREVQ